MEAELEDESERNATVNHSEGEHTLVKALMSTQENLVNVFSGVKNNHVDPYLKRKYVNSAVCGQNFHLSVINLDTELNT